MKKFKKLAVLFSIALAMCLCITSCGKDEEISEADIQQMLVGEWEIDEEIGNDLMKHINLRANGYNVEDMYIHKESNNEQWRWIYDPATRTLSYYFGYSLPSGTYGSGSSATFVYTVVKVDSEHLTLRTNYKTYDNFELHYKKVANNQEKMVAKGKYKRADFIGNWKMVAYSLNGRDSKPVDNDQIIRFTFNNDWYENFFKNESFLSYMKYDGKYWLYDPVRNILQLGSATSDSFYQSTESETAPTVIEPEMTNYRNLYEVEELTADRLVLHPLSDMKNTGTEHYTGIYQRMK